MASNIDLVKVWELFQNPDIKQESGRIPKGGEFYIPKYQRGYRWTSMQVEQLLDDIYEFEYKQDLDNFYCLQPLVVQYDEENKRWVVIDGQQRLTTIFIITKCLRMIADSQRKKPIYTLNYESKPQLWDVLNGLGKDEDLELDTSDIDKYFITNAFKIVEKWVAKKPKNQQTEDFAADLAKKIREQTRFVWYEIDNGKDPESNFTNINMGKIPLTNAELIKALLLKRDNFTKDEDFRAEQAKISMDWDTKENHLRKENFWLFLTNDKNEKQDVRMDLVFDAMARNFLAEGFVDSKEADREFEALRLNNPVTYLFLIFSEKLNKMIEAEKESAKVNNTKYRFSNVLNDFWKQVCTTYQMFEDWYEEKEWYHLVGYWIAARELDSKKFDFTEILHDLSANYLGKSKSEFTRYLQDSIFRNMLGLNPKQDISGYQYDDLVEAFTSLRYDGGSDDKRRIKKILLLFNVITMQNNKEFDARFPFNYYKKTVWNLEHIHAATTDVPKDDVGRNNWLAAVNEFLCSVDYVSDELKTRLSQFVVTKDNSDEFSELYTDVVKTFSGDLLDDDLQMVMGLPNMTLLDEVTNKSYQNDIFPMKRNYIMGRMGQENFIPICTKNVFLKYYTDDVKQYYVWDKNDRDCYFNEMCSTIYEYLEPERSLGVKKSEEGEEK